MKFGGGTSLIGRAATYWAVHGPRATISLATVYGPSILYHRRLGTRSYNSSGVDIFAEDWDNLIILDACRFDVFDRRAGHLPGNTTPRESRAASTSEFIRANFTGKTLGDVVYLSANPWFAKLHDEIDASVYAYDPIHNEPEERPQIDQMHLTTESARDAVDRYPHKRLLIHYVPPHHPLFGPTAEEHLPSIESQLEMGFYERIRRGDLVVDDDILDQAYGETFDAVLEQVETLLPVLRGKTVIAADHGEMLGERSHPVPVKYYGHVPGLYTDELVTIPWHECPYEERREIIAESPNEGDSLQSTPDQSSVNDRLEALGYRM